MKRQLGTTRRPWWSADDAAVYLGITSADLRELGGAGTGPKYTETPDGLRRYRPSDVRLWGSAGLVRDSRGWNGAAR
ncbi:hypothetical protein ACFVX9_03735 [Kitasatospora sp. NPDC058243]|uniref:hypothetical protein n=1 Tax=Kitasatospora sp. NPDC058243 TaxID=3346397 RepID=UPI0036DAA061